MIIVHDQQVTVCRHVNKTLECKFVNRQKCNAVKEQNVTGNEIADIIYLIKN